MRTSVHFALQLPSQPQRQQSIDANLIVIHLYEYIESLTVLAEGSTASARLSGDDLAALLRPISDQLHCLQGLLENSSIEATLEVRAKKTPA